MPLSSPRRTSTNTSTRSSSRVNNPQLFFDDEMERRSPRVNTFIKGERSQRLTVGKNNSAPNETTIRIYYSDVYKKFQEDTPVKTRVVIESIDGGYSKEVEIEIRKKQ